ncbi:MAG: SDR family oxidoreductase [Deltaproteobacteria bacterium]|nr:SDR family oxidoreductase [Deltaproteobacteria bacterium]
MDLNLKDKVVMVTGASRGIGRAIAFILAAEGAALALCGRTESAIKEAAKEIASRHDPRIYAGSWDLAKPGAIDGFLRASLAELGRVDVLVNNVGAGFSKSFDDLTEDEWREVLEKNFWIALRCSRAVVPLMKRNGSGRIINIAALSGKLPRRGQVASNTAKAALINLTESLAAELGADGIRVNAVCPAAILTERWQARIEKIAHDNHQDYATTIRELARTRIPAGRFGLPDDVAHLVAFLASDKSDFINGVSIEVDGGLGRSLALEIQ